MLDSASSTTIAAAGDSFVKFDQNSSWVSSSPVLECRVCRLEYSGETKLQDDISVPHGIGTLLCRREGIHYSHSGTFNFGRRNGLGVTNFLDGKVELSGHWMEDQLTPRGKICLRGSLAEAFQCYEGTLRNHVPHGNGRMLWPNGFHFKGRFEDGKRHGPGMLSHADGHIVYLGNFDSNQPHGQTEWNERADGAVFTGCMTNGLPEPYGRLYEKGRGSRLIYDGQWRRGLPHGFGTMYFQDGFYDGYFVNGKREGLGKYHKNDGNVYCGKWHRDLPYIEEPSKRSFTERGSLSFRGSLTSRSNPISRAQQMNSGALTSRGVARGNYTIRVLTDVQFTPTSAYIKMPFEGYINTIGNAQALLSALECLHLVSQDLWTAHVANCEKREIQNSNRIITERNRKRTCRLVVRSAEGLPIRVNPFTSISYTCVLGLGEITHETRPSTVPRGSHDPIWNEVVDFTLNDDDAFPSDILLQIKAATSGSKQKITIAGLIYPIDLTNIRTGQWIEDGQGGRSISLGTIKAGLTGSDPDTGLKIHVGRVIFDIVLLESTKDQKMVTFENYDPSNLSSSTTPSPTNTKRKHADNEEIASRIEAYQAAQLR